MRMIVGVAVVGAMLSTMSNVSASTSVVNVSLDQKKQISIDEAKTRNWTKCAAGGAVGGLLANQAGKKLMKEFKPQMGGLGFGKNDAEKAITAYGAFAGCALVSNFSNKEKKDIAEAESKAVTNGSYSYELKANSRSTSSSDSKRWVHITRGDPVTILGREDLNCFEVQSNFETNNKIDASSDAVKCETDDGTYEDAAVIL